MKPRLVIGLGNPLMGDDGIGSILAERLAADPRLPADTEVFLAGTDLLRCAGRLEGRTHLVVLDAIQSGQPAGTVTVFNPRNWGRPEPVQYAHHLSLFEGVRLLGLLTTAKVTVVTIALDSVRAAGGLSPELAARVPRIMERVLAVCRQG